MAIDRLTANRAIVDEKARPLPEFIQMWAKLAEDADANTDVLYFYALAQTQAEANAGLAYAAGLAQITADQALAGTARSGVEVQYVTTTGASWVTAATESLATVSAGDLTILNSGPLLGSGADGVTEGEFRIVEQPGATTLFTGLWRATGDGVSYSLVQNLSILDTLTFSTALASTGSVDYDLDFRVTDGVDVTLLAYLMVRRS